MTAVIRTLFALLFALSAVGLGATALIDDSEPVQASCDSEC